MLGQWSPVIVGNISISGQLLYHQRTTYLSSVKFQYSIFRPATAPVERLWISAKPGLEFRLTTFDGTTLSIGTTTAVGLNTGSGLSSRKNGVIRGRKALVFHVCEKASRPGNQGISLFVSRLVYQINPTYQAASFVSSPPILLVLLHS